MDQADGCHGRGWYDPRASSTREGAMDPATQFEFGIPYNGIVFGVGSSKTVGQRTRALGARNVMLTTDKSVRGAGLVAPVEESLRAAGLQVEVWDEISTEPTFDSVHAG